MAYLRKAIAATPDLWSAHSELGINLMRLGREGDGQQKATATGAGEYDNDFTADSGVTSNALTLMDSYNKFVTYETPTTALRLNKKEAVTLLRALFRSEEMKRAMANVYEKKYKACSEA